MKRKFLTLMFGLISATFIVLTGSAGAADVLNPACQGVSDSTACQSNTNQPTTGNSIYGPNGVLTKAASLIAVVVGIASVIMIIVGGFKYVTSSGDPNSVQSAKNTVLFAVVGMLVALTAQSLVVLVLRNL